ncbi:MAG: hypothetical protein GY756_18980, partial [bacterium]|nr:hypothetical protein [bacterium]
MTMKYLFYVIIIVMSLNSCVTNYKTLDPVVNKCIVKCHDNKIPSELNKVIKSHKIIILGETHYVQEHQEFIIELLKELQKGKENIVFIQENPNAFNWMLEDYLNGKIDSLPTNIRFFDNYLFENIKAINSGQTKQIGFVYMDVNHGKSFLASLLESEKIIGNQPEFDEVKDALFDS